jgi:uridylate kinase
MGDKQFGIDNGRLAQYAEEVKSIVDKGIECAIVIGGGNIFRGVQAEEGAWSEPREITWACWPP